MEQNLALLNAPFPAEIIEEKNGFSYIPHPYVTARLNEALGVGGWSFQVLDTRWIESEDTILVLGRITAFMDGGLGHVSKEQWGGQKVNRFSSSKGGAIIDISNDFKGAASDALKKCATLLGVGEELYMQGHKPAQEKPSAPRPAMDKPSNLNLPMPKAREGTPDKVLAGEELITAILAERGQRKDGWPTIFRVLEGKGIPSLDGKSPTEKQLVVFEFLGKLTQTEANTLLTVLQTLPKLGG